MSFCTQSRDEFVKALEERMAIIYELEREDARLMGSDEETANDKLQTVLVELGEALRLRRTK